MTGDTSRPLPASLTTRLAAMYGEPHRRYHTLAHVEALLRWLRHWHALATKGGPPALPGRQ